MNGKSIAAGALGRDGLGLLTPEFGHTRLAEIMNARRDSRAVAPDDDGVTGTAEAEAARATRP